jgi:UDP-glucose 4-epimerase
MVFNIACGERHSLLSIIESLESAVGHPLERRHEQPRLGDIKHTSADIAEAKAHLGFEVAVGFDEGLERTWAAFNG